MKHIEEGERVKMKDNNGDGRRKQKKGGVGYLGTC